MAQFDFLASFVEDVLNQNGLDRLSDEQKRVYVPQVLARLEERIGLELIPKLSDAQVEELGRMLEKNESSPEEWKRFWQTSIPNFEEEVKTILLAFAEDVKRILA